MFISVSNKIPIPQKIISLVPSQTELLSYLGLEKETIGITKFCVHPEEWFHTKTRIGGTKNADIETIIALNPDLILCNKEENVKEQVEILAEKFPVYMSDVNTYTQALQMIADVGKLTGKTDQASTLTNLIIAQFETLENEAQKIRAAYFIWKDPYMTIGGDTFISDMMEKAGFENIYKDRGRYPEINMEEFKKLQPEIILLSSEPYPFQEKHITEIKSILQGVQILLVDGEMFSWYGSRMRCAPGYFTDLRKQIHT